MTGKTINQQGLEVREVLPIDITRPGDAVSVMKDPDTGAEVQITMEMRDLAIELNRRACTALVEAITPFARIRREKLYLALGYTTFEHYALQEIGLAKSQAYQRCAIEAKFGDLLPAVGSIGVSKLAQIAELPDEELERFRQKQAICLGETIYMLADLQRLPVKELRARIKESKPEKRAEKAKPRQRKEKTEDDGARYYIASAGNTLRVYERLIAGAEWQGPEEIAQALGLTSETAFRCLKTLELERWVRSAAGRYTVSKDHLDQLAIALGERTARAAESLARTHDSLARIKGGTR